MSAPAPSDTNPLLAARVAAERALVGCAFLAPAETRQVCGWLRHDAFWLESCGRFWQRFVAGEDAIAAGLDTGLADRALGWSNDVPSYTYAPEYARKVAEGAYLTDMTRLAAQLADAAYKADVATAKETQAALAALLPHTHSGARNWFEVAVTFIETLNADIRSLPTGLAPLDRAVAGLERQTLSVIAARPSQGKSTLGLQIAMNAAKHGARCLFVSLEMSETNLFARAACPLVGVTWLDVRRGVVSQADKNRLETAAAELGSEYAPYLSVYDRRATTDTVWELAQAQQADLVFVDHLRKLDDAPDLPEVKRLGGITSRLKRMAKELNLHACALVQLNRGADADANAAPELKHLRDSGEIEEDADLVLMLHGLPVPELRKQLPTRDTDLWVRKARDGVKDAKIELRYDLRAQKFAGRRDAD